MVQVGNDSLNQSGGSRGTEKWSDSSPISKVKPTEFLDKMDACCERGKSRMTKVFSLSNMKDGVSNTEMRTITEQV